MVGSHNIFWDFFGLKQSPLSVSTSASLSGILRGLSKQSFAYVANPEANINQDHVKITFSETLSPKYFHMALI